MFKLMYCNIRTDMVESGIGVGFGCKWLDFLFMPQDVLTGVVGYGIFCLIIRCRYSCFEYKLFETSRVNTSHNLTLKTLFISLSFSYYIVSTFGCFPIFNLIRMRC
jgi:hypothetical protein